METKNVLNVLQAFTVGVVTADECERGLLYDML